MLLRGKSEREEFVDAGRFIVTDRGTVYRSTEQSLNEYAPGLLQRVPLGHLVKDADLWLRMPVDLSLWCLPVGLWYGGPWLGAGGMISVYVVTAVLSPAGVSLYAMPLVRFIDRVPAQAVYFIVVLSLLAQNARFPELWTGVAGFVALRWAILPRALNPVVERACYALYGMRIEDQVLRAVMIRYAIRHGISIPSLSGIEDDVKSVTGSK